MHYVPREAEKLRNKLSFELNSQRLKRKHAVHSVYTILVHGGAKKTSCCITDDERPHRCCQIRNEVENIECTPELGCPKIALSQDSDPIPPGV